MKNLYFLLFILLAVTCVKKDEVVKIDTTYYIGTTRYIHFYIDRGFVKRDTLFRQDTFKVIETLDSIFFKPEVFPNNKGFIKNKVENSYFINEEFGNGNTRFTFVAPDSLINNTYFSIRNSLGTDKNDYIFFGKKAF
jgi:hypothetical protein